jgi:phenylacetate-coenzyme A ligase PaaK-like adenylate-forming protein
MAILPNPKFIKLYMKHNQTVERLWRLSLEELRQFQKEKLHEMMDYAQKTTLYQDKFQQGQITKASIKDISDVKKIPFTTKQDLRDYGVNGTLPADFDMDKGYKVVFWA